MFKLRSISARLILAISLTVAAACAILGTFSIVQQRSLMRLALEQQLKLQYDSVIAAIDYEGRTALAVSEVRKVLAFVEGVKTGGHACIYIEHNLAHVHEVALHAMLVDIHEDIVPFGKLNIFQPWICQLEYGLGNIKGSGSRGDARTDKLRSH